MSRLLTVAGRSAIRPASTVSRLVTVPDRLIFANGGLRRVFFATANLIVTRHAAAATSVGQDSPESRHDQGRNRRRAARFDTTWAFLVASVASVGSHRESG